MKKNNRWNKFFHKQDIINNQHKYELAKRLQETGKGFLTSITQAVNLPTLLAIHKDAWGTGFQNQNLGPNEFGIVRTKDVTTMNTHQVFLGNIYGLNTFAIAYWEQYKDETFGANGFGIKEDASLYNIILDQYKTLLYSNIEELWKQACHNKLEYELHGYRSN